MIGSQLPMFPRYDVGGRRFLTLRDAAQAIGTVTANPAHELERRPGDAPRMAMYNRRAKVIIANGQHRRPTLLKEVEAVFPEPNPSLRKLYAKPRGEKVVASWSELADAGLRAVEMHLEATWDPEARHVVMFSSGYDSRILGAVLRRISDRRGGGWLGRSYFMCAQPEVAFARKSYEATGLPLPLFTGVGGGAVDYYAECLDFRTVGSELSEAERFWGAPLKIQRNLSGYLDTSQKLQGACALFGDELTKWNRLGWGNVAWFLSCFAFDNPGVLPGRPDCEFILPFASEAWVRLQTTYRMPNFAEYPEHIRKLVHGVSAIDAFKLSMLHQIDPALPLFPNWRFEAKEVREKNRGPSDPGRGHIDQQKISQKTAEKMEDDYRKSWYAKALGPATLDYQRDRTFVYWSDHNSHYMKAAIYQNLIDLGVTVRK